MWQTELNIFLQKLSSEYLTGFLTFITNVGGAYAAIAISIVIMFGVSFRKGFILLQVCAFSRCINDALKIFFALPRPVSVDSNVQILWKNKPNTTPLTSMGAKKFISLLPEETIDFFRTHKLGSYGFPSGTSTQAISFWGMMLMFFKKVWVRIIALFFICLIPLSRIYFGKHFLADVLGSFVVSFLIIGFFYQLVYKNEKLLIFLFDEKGWKIDKSLIILIIYLFVLPFALLMLPKLAREMLGPILGINAGFMLIRYKGIPKDEGDLKKRLFRIGVAGFCYFLFMAGPQLFIQEFIHLKMQWALIVSKALGAFLFILSAVKINIRLEFFQHQNK